MSVYQHFLTYHEKPDLLLSLLRFIPRGCYSSTWQPDQAKRTECRLWKRVGSKCQGRVRQSPTSYCLLRTFGMQGPRGHRGSQVTKGLGGISGLEQICGVPWGSCVEGAVAQGSP